VWRHEDAVFCFLPRPAPGRLVARSVSANAMFSASTDRASRDSARLESAALIVRATLMAVIAGDTVGEPPPAPKPKAKDLPPPPALAAPIPAKPRAALTGFFGTAASVDLDGLGNQPMLSLALRAGAEREWLRGLCSLEWAEPQTLRAGSAAPATLSRQAIEVGVVAWFWRHPRARSGVEASTGMAMFQLDPQLPTTQTQRTAHILMDLGGVGGFDLIRAPFRLTIVGAIGVRGVLGERALYSSAGSVRSMNVFFPHFLLGLELGPKVSNP